LEEEKRRRKEEEVVVLETTQEIEVRKDELNDRQRALEAKAISLERTTSATSSMHEGQLLKALNTEQLQVLDSVAAKFKKERPRSTVSLLLFLLSSNSCLPIVCIFYIQKGQVL
jgi:hypothetical protein